MHLQQILRLSCPSPDKKHWFLPIYFIALICYHAIILIQQHSQNGGIPIDAQFEAEQFTHTLRALYQQYGYVHYSMSHFEPYELYVRNKDYLASERMIVFTDLNGALMALKPDVTISIIKNTAAEPGTVQKLYYTENVYRADAKAGAFREILQTGLECIGEIDAYQLCEVLLLAAKSLEATGREFVLDLSHLGLVSGMLEAAGVPEGARPELMRLIRDKNLPAVQQRGRALGCDETLLTTLVTVYGPLPLVLPQLRALCRNGAMAQALYELECIYPALDAAGLCDRVRLDFSVMSDLRYYNGIIFQGFLRDVSAAVLSGGQYDQLMRKMDKTDRAVGFAVYLDQLETLDTHERGYDADVLLLYPSDAAPQTLARAVQRIAAQGKRVCAQRRQPTRGRYREIIRLEDWRDEP